MTPNTVDLASKSTIFSVPPLMEDNESRLSAHETTGWKPVVHDRLEAYPPSKLTVSGITPHPSHG